MARGKLSDYDRQRLNEMVESLRAKVGWSFRKLSEETGIHLRTLGELKDSKRTLTEDQRHKLFQVFCKATDSQGEIFDRRYFLKVAGLSPAYLTVEGISESTRTITSLNEPDPPNQYNYEESAELAHRDENWRRAAGLWLLLADKAAARGDWPKWAIWTTQAAQMQIFSSQFALAKSGLEGILSKGEVGVAAKAAALVRLEWLHYELDDFAQAQGFALRAQASLKDLARSAESLRIAQHNFMLAGAGEELAEILQATSLHFLGGTLGDQAVRQGDIRLAMQGLDSLRAAYYIDNRHDAPANMGFGLLRVVPIISTFPELDEFSPVKFTTPHSLLDQGVEMLPSGGTVMGHITYSKALLEWRAQAENKEDKEVERNIDLLKEAASGFGIPIYYPRGLSRVLSLISGRYLLLNNPEAALQYALVATVLHPYGRNLEILSSAVHAVHRSIGNKQLDYYWAGLVQDVYSRYRGPFAHIKPFIDSIGIEQGSQYLIATIGIAEKLKRSYLHV